MRYINIIFYPFIILASLLVTGCAGTSTEECLSCSTYVYNGNVYRRTGYGSESEANQVARDFCAERGFNGDPSLGPAMRWNEGYYYQINCAARKTIPDAPTALPINTPSSPAYIAPSVTITQAKEKCSDLGFKTDTEAYGSCVLKLTK